MFSSIIGLKASDSSEKLKLYLSKVLNYSSIIVIPMMFGTFIFAPSLMTLVYGQKYLAAGLSLQLIAWALFFQFACNICFGALTAFEKTKQLAVTYLAATALGLALALITIPTTGILGASFTFLAVNVMLFTALAFAANKLVKLDLKNALFKPIVSAAIMSTILIYSRTLAKPSVTLDLLLIAIGAVIYFTTLYFLKGFSKEDLKLVKYVK